MFPLASIACTMTAAGITTPPLQDIISSLVASMQIIFGTDIYLDVSTQDYQLIALVAQAQYDSNLATIAAYLQFSPQSATGQGLDSCVKVNGIERDDPEFSSAVCILVGRVGFQIPAGTLIDPAGNIWNLPANLTITPDGTVAATASCTVAGPITAAANALEINSILLGWDSVTNLQAIPGAVVETDGILRQRQTISTALPSRTQLGAIAGAVANVPGVQISTVYQNDTNETDANGLPPHSCSAVVAGGDATAIAQAIELTKDGGCASYGSTTVVVDDPNGLPIPINFWELDEIQIYVGVTIETLAGFVGSTEAAISAAAAAFINSLDTGQNCWPSWINAAAALAGTTVEETFVITELFLGTAPAPTGTAYIPILFNQKAVCLATNVVVTT
jgi:uncharacterized phage protein gp47/JayE